MTGLLIVTIVLSSFHTPEDEKPSRSSTSVLESEKAALHKDFDRFRHKYIAVYLVIMLADWMQGTHMYTLYLSYNVNISALFLTGFLSGALFAPFLGSAVDKFGRKNSCIVYCVLEIIINCLEHSSDFNVLLFGRVLGGISTNLLFSAFESWMTTEHRKRGFPDEWLSRTYSEVSDLKGFSSVWEEIFSIDTSIINMLLQASIGNGAMAILAGILAQILEDSLGHIGPFQGAVALTVLALILILPWEENYGEKKDADEGHSSLYDQFSEAWKTTLSNSHIWKIGMTQALSEGAMYTVSSCVATVMSAFVNR
jgi:MFS family permease